MKIINWLYIHPYKFALLIFFSLALFYASTIPQFNVGFADSDEFLAVSQNWGLAHPPGYSLYVTVLYFFMHLPLPLTTPAFRAHLVSALSTATAIGLTLPLLRLVFQALIPKKSKNSSLFILTSIIVLWTLATSKQLWLYSQITEKYLFAGPLLVLFLLFGIKLITTTVTKKTYLFFTLIFGLLIGHHQSLIFLFPYLCLSLYFGLKSSKQGLSKFGLSLIGLFIGIGLSLFILLIQINRQSAVPVTWLTSPGLTGAVQMITRADFRGELYLQDTTTSGYIPANLSANQLMSGFPIYFNNFGQAFNWWIFIPLFFSLLYLSQSKKNSLTLILILAPLFLGPLLLGYLTWPEDLASQAITERFFLLSYLTFTPLIFIGMYEILRRLSLALKIFKLTPVSKTIFASLIPLALLIQTIQLYPQISLKNFDLVHRLYSNILAEVKTDSLVTCYSDSSCFALLYEQTVNHMRPDVDIVPLAYPLVSQNIAAKHLNKFTYTDNPFLIFDIVTNNLDKRPVYAVDMNRYYFSFFGISNAFMFSLPDGYKTELTRYMPDDLPHYDYQITKDYQQYSFPEFDKYRLYLAETLVQNHISNSYTYLKRGERSRAQIELNDAVNLAYRLSPLQTKIIQGTRGSVESTQIDPRFKPGSLVVNIDDLLSAIPELTRQSKNAEVYKTYLGILSIDPDNLPARTELARIYQKYNDVQFARIEYQNILIIDPTNQEALDYLQ